MKNNFQQLIDLFDHASQAQASWLRQVLTLASGGLALLVGLRPEVPPEGIAQYLLAATWLCLGLGVVFGASATYAEVNLSKNLASRFREELQKSLAQKTQMSSAPITAKVNRFFVVCRVMMILSLLLSVVCLVGYAILTTLNV